MLLLQDIMTRDVVTLSPEHTLRDAMSLFASKHISGAPVVANQTVVGVVSLTDLAEPGWDALEAHTVGDAMSRNVKSMLPSTPVDFAADFMKKASIHRVLVMEEGRLLGVVSTKDIADAVADHRLPSRTYVFGASRHVERP